MDIEEERTNNYELTGGNFLDLKLSLHSHIRGADALVIPISLGCYEGKYVATGHYIRLPEITYPDVWGHMRNMVVVIKLLLHITFCGPILDPEPPLCRARKKLKNSRHKRLRHSNDAKLTTRDFTRIKKRKLLKRGKQGVAYNITVNDSAQVAVGDNARIVNKRYCNCKQDGIKGGCSTRQGVELIKFLKGFYRTGVRTILQPLPRMEGDQFHIGNIYTKTKIVERNTNHVTSLEEISLKAATDPKNPRLILIEGEPGIGKSAVCKKIAYDWSTNKLFKKFKVVLFLKCRDFHTGNELWDAIEMQTFSDDLKEKKTDIFEYIKSNQSKVLLVLDGYDEIPDTSAASMKQSIDRLICGKLLPECSVIMTSRPGKGSEVRNHFDKKLEIKGFNLNDAFTFIKRFFDSSPEDASALISFIKDCEDVQDLVRSPLLTAILCLVYQKKKEDDYLVLETLYRKIVFCLTRRYCTEKLDREMRDDDEFHDLIYFLGKQAFLDAKGNHCGISEKEFAVASTGVATSAQLMAMGFLVNRKILNKIRPENSYQFCQNSLKEYLAVQYITISFTSLNTKEIRSIITFKNFGSFSRTLKMLYTFLKFKTCIVAHKSARLKVVLKRIIPFIIGFISFILYSIYLVIKITITCLLRSVMASRA